MGKDISEQIKRTFRHSGIYGLGSLLKGLSGLLLIPIYTRFLSVGDFGRWGLLFASGQVIRVVVGLGLVSAVFRSYFDYTAEAERRQVVFTAFVIQAASSVLFLLAACVYSRPLSVFLLGGGEFQLQVVLIAVYAVLFGFHRIALTVFRARGQSLRYILFEGIGFLAHLFLAALLIAVFRLGIDGAVWGLLIGSLVTTALSYASAWNDMRGSFSCGEAKKMLLYGLPTVVTVLSILVINFADRYLIKLFLGFEHAGLYELGYHFGMILLLFFATPVRLVWEPMYLSVKDQPQARAYYSRVLTYACGAGMSLVLAVSLFSRDIIRFISPENFWTAARVVPLVALGYFVFGCERLIRVGIGLSRKTYIASIIFVIGAVINILLNILWIPGGGIMGAAHATLVTALIVLLGVYAASRRFYPIDYEWSRISKIFFAGSAVYALGGMAFAGSGPGPLGGRVLAFLLYPVLLTVLGFFSETEKRGITRFFKAIMMALKKGS